MGVVGHSSDVRNQYGSSADVVSAFPVASSSSMKYTDKSYEAEDMQRQVPVSFPVTQQQSSRHVSSSSQQRETSTNREDGTPYVRVTPVYRDSNFDVGNGYYTPTQGRQTVYVRPGSTITYRVPVRVVPNTSDQQSSSRSEYSETAGNTRHQTGTQQSTYYRPVYEESSSLSSRSQNQSEYRVVPGSSVSVQYPSVQQVIVPEKLVQDRYDSGLRNYGSYHRQPEVSSSQTRQQAESQSQSQHRYVSSLNTPANGGTSRYSTSAGGYSNRYIPPASSSTGKSELDEDVNDNVQTRLSGSSHSSRIHDNRQYGTSYVVPSSNSRSSYQAAQKSESTQNRVYPTYTEAPIYDSRSRQHTSSRTQAGSDYERSSQSQYGNSGNNYDRNVAYGNSGSSRLGSAVFDNSNSDLNAYMSESERLARLQSQSVSSSSTSRHHSENTNIDEINRRTLQQAENLDAASANFINTNSNRLNLDNMNIDAYGSGSGAGGYKRIKSWSKQSKWASGSEYGPDGKPKSYSMLSTGESENHNINGAETGYQAATTTLDNDGKTSTYSIHTP